MSGLDAERAKKMNAEIRARVVDQVHAAMLVTEGTSGAPTKQRIAEQLDFALDECLDHPDYQDMDHFHMSGFVVQVKRDERRGYWDTYRVLVPATKDMCNYRTAALEEPET